jgi:hypothetical protein
MREPNGAAERHTVAWWEQLLLERPKRKVTPCPACGTLNDSIDVVCTADASALVGTEMSDSRKGVLVNSLRIMAVAVALAVGYLNWTWPAYAFTFFLLVAFFALFLRNHPTSKYFFLGISTSGFVGYAMWRLLAPAGAVLLHAFLFLLAALLFLELPFLVAYTLRVQGGDARRRGVLAGAVDLGPSNLAWIALMLTAAALCGLTAATSWLGGLLASGSLQVSDINSLLVRAALTTAGAAEIAVLVSSTLHSLRGEPFSVADRWTFEPILRERVFRRWPLASPPTSASWTERLAYLLWRLGVSFANGLIQGIENAYHSFAVRFVNTLAQTAVRIANSIRRAAISTALHTMRSLRRFMMLNRSCGQWAFRTFVRYIRVFVVPVTLCLTGATLPYAIGDDFAAYVHGGSLLLPIVLLAKGVLVVALFTVGTGLLLRVDLRRYFEKVLNALSTFGTSAFLFFVLSAWLLGAVGMLTDGPYRIGWVTVASTLLLVTVFVLAQRRRHDAESED